MIARALSDNPVIRGVASQWERWRLARIADRIATGEPSPAPTPSERIRALALLAVALVLRLVYIRHFRIDSDEPQHLHVVWAWANGLLPYRDVFDNHAPLFQALCAPLFHWLGVRADIIYPMRAAMLLIFGLTIFGVWKIAGTLFDARTALWTAVLTALYPSFFYSSIEFRPDELWSLLWIAILAVTICGRFSARRAFSVGLLFGVALCVSMKTTLFAIAFLLAVAGTLLAQRLLSGRGVDYRRLLKMAGAASLGALIVPALVILYFVAHGAAAEMYYGVIRHNVISQPQQHSWKSLRPFLRLLLWVPPAVLVMMIIHRLPKPAAVRSRIAFLFIATFSYYAVLVNCWPILTEEDYLPFYPAMMACLAPVGLWFGRQIISSWNIPSWSLPTLAVVAQFACILSRQSPWVDQTQDKVGLVADTLRLTDSSDYVMDGKGETIYRRRPFYFVMEALTKKRLKHGTIEDETVTQLIATRTPVLSSRRLTKAAHEFVRANYIPIAFRLRVLGQNLHRVEGQADAGTSFNVAIPSEYTIVTRDGSAKGTLDGSALSGPRFLDAGPHQFTPEKGSADCVLVWARAVERGFSPFAQIKPDYTTEQD